MEILSCCNQHPQPSTSNGSLAKHHNSPSRLCEEMIKCISAIYCQLAVSSSTPEYFPQAQSGKQANNPFHFEDSKEMVESAYNTGGNTVSVDMIQNSILQCQLPHPGQRLQSLFFTKQRFKAGDARKGYAIEHPDPLLRFALCSGNHSVPVLRLYTSKRVFEELEVAKDDYIQANIRVRKEQKLVLPKNVESYIKEVNLSPSCLFETIALALPAYLRKKFQQPEQRKLWKKIDWIPHNLSFRYLISSELVE
ncbi:hypothetical protein RND71_000234 [Anisodus tanguticus]|uniref:DUF547 domain-containing protein n=1 Tax=Anisodus tanguticus TaxID=243964 RepID=A0AAE1SYC5_9SOLA|nr:hypothetical protein RND71_000234 [Anisodus tanguticus]